MTAEQFDALAELLRLRNGPSRAAARLALVEGVAQADIPARVGLSGNAAWQAVRRARAGLQLAERACGLTNSKAMPG